MTIAVMDFGLILVLVRWTRTRPPGGPAQEGALTRLPLLQVLQSCITAFLWRVIGRSQEGDWDHAQLDPAPKEDLQDQLEDDGSWDPQQNQLGGPRHHYSHS